MTSYIQPLTIYTCIYHYSDSKLQTHSHGGGGDSSSSETAPLSPSEWHWPSDSQGSMQYLCIVCGTGKKLKQNSTCPNFTNVLYW